MKHTNYDAMPNRACDQCRVSKKRCEKLASSNTQCRICTSFGKPCSYEIAPKKPGPKPKSELSNLKSAGTFSKIDFKIKLSESKVPVPELIPDAYTKDSASSSPMEPLCTSVIDSNLNSNNIVFNLDLNCTLETEPYSPFPYNTSPLLDTSQLLDTNIPYECTYPPLIPAAIDFPSHTNFGPITVESTIYNSPFTLGLGEINQLSLVPNPLDQIQTNLVFGYGISTEKVEMLVYFVNSIQDFPIKQEIIQTLSFLTKNYFKDSPTQILLAFIVRCGYLMAMSYPSLDEVSWLKKECPQLITQIPGSHIDGNLILKLYQITLQSVYERIQSTVY